MKKFILRHIGAEILTFSRSILNKGNLSVDGHIFLMSVRFFASVLKKLYSGMIL